MAEPVIDQSAVAITTTIRETRAPARAPLALCIYHISHGPEFVPFLPGGVWGREGWNVGIFCVCQQLFGVVGEFGEGHARGGLDFLLLEQLLVVKANFDISAEKAMVCLAACDCSHHKLFEPLEDSMPHQAVQCFRMSCNCFSLCCFLRQDLTYACTDAALVFFPSQLVVPSLSQTQRWCEEVYWP